MEPKVSVLTCVYNGERYLSEAIDSVLGQSMTDFEYIIVNDGSTDGTKDILTDYQSRDRRIKVIDKPNSGPGDSRNVGLQAACGKWVAILDADDVALLDRLMSQLNYLRNRPEILLVGGYAAVTDENGHQVRVNTYPSEHEQLLNNLEEHKVFVPHSSCLYHRETVLKLEGYNSYFVVSEDHDLFLRLAQHGKLGCVDQVVVKLRIRGDSLSHARYDRILLMGMAGLVCHFRRKNGASDPSQSDKCTWDRFITRLEQELSDRGYFGERQAAELLRKHWFDISQRSSAVFTKLAYFALHLAGHPSQMIGLSRRVLSSSNKYQRLAKTLASITLS